jgi:hypothetical protein
MVHCLGGFRWLWGSKATFGELGNFSPQGVDLGHCVGGFK